MDGEKLPKLPVVAAAGGGGRRAGGADPDHQPAPGDEGDEPSPEKAAGAAADS